MQQTIKHFEDLLHFIGNLFEVDLSKLNISPYDNRLPKSLQYLYAIEDFFAKHDCKFETVRFFNNQFHLIPYSKLALENDSYDIVFENQNNWKVAYHRNENAVYLSEHFELPYNTRLTDELESFLISFALQEIMFNCNHYCQLDYKGIEELEKEIPLHKLWYGKMIDYPINFYLTNENAIVMDGGWIVLSTNNEIIFEKMKQITKAIIF
jgi:hypothetical protein